MEVPKTKQLAEIFKSLNTGARKTLFVLPEHNDNIYRSFRNIPSVCGTLLSDVNTYNIINSSIVVFTESAAKIFVEENIEEKEGAEGEI
jgi:large subunit ribosomal protein L4